MKKLLTLAFMAMLGTSVFAQAKYPYLDTKLSYKERVENLLSLLTPEDIYRPSGHPKLQLVE